jgi:hypothetical protein
MPVAKGQRLPGAGRPKGSANKATLELKEKILLALDMVGGEKYLAQQAIENPPSFLALIGKVLPKDIHNKVDGKINITSIVRKIVDADSNKHG